MKSLALIFTLVLLGCSADQIPDIFKAKSFEIVHKNATFKSQNPDADVLADDKKELEVLLRLIPSKKL